MTISYDQIIQDINTLNDDSALRLINSAVIERISALSYVAATNWSVGDQVEATGKNGKRIQGQITKINQKNVIVATLLGRYTVPAAMLRTVA